MLGTRDSEIGALIEDTDTIKIKMNGEHYKVSKCVHEFRVQLFMQHYGAQDAFEVADPLLESTWNNWK